MSKIKLVYYIVVIYIVSALGKFFVWVASGLNRLVAELIKGAEYTIAKDADLRMAKTQVEFREALKSRDKV